MKILSEKTVGGKRRLVVELGEGETLQGLSPGGYYRLGYPHDDIVPAHVLEDLKPVVWDSLSQKWID